MGNMGLKSCDCERFGECCWVEAGDDDSWSFFCDMYSKICCFTFLVLWLLLRLFANQQVTWEINSPPSRASSAFSSSVGYGYERCSKYHLLRVSTALAGSIRLDRRPDPESPVVVAPCVDAGLISSPPEGMICDSSRSCINFSSFFGWTDPLCANVLQERTLLLAIHFLTCNKNKYF